MKRRPLKPKRAMRTGKNDISSFLAPYPPKIRSLANTLRSIVRTTLPHSEEAVYRGWQLIGYRIVDGRESTYCCFIAPTDEFVKLGFEHGKHLTDPHGLLTGSGSTVRQVIIRSGKDIRTKALRALIAEAAIYIMFRRAILGKD